MGFELHHGDCLDVMATLPDASIDCVLTDPPYGTTACKWDSVIPFEPMWKELKRIAKPKAAICLFGSQPFTSALVMSNPKMFKYQWYWVKERGTGFAQSANRPLNLVEDITVFYNNQTSFNPQRRKLHKSYLRRLTQTTSESGNIQAMATRPEDNVVKLYTHDTPTQLLTFIRENGCKNDHPTQKPVELLRYLIRTYTLEGQTVLDFTMGSGSTGVACELENRNFIGIEKDASYFEIAKNRIEGVKKSEPLFEMAA